MQRELTKVRPVFQRRLTNVSLPPCPVERGQDRVRGTCKGTQAARRAYMSVCDTRGQVW